MAYNFQVYFGLPSNPINIHKQKLPGEKINSSFCQQFLSFGPGFFWLLDFGPRGHLTDYLPTFVDNRGHLTDHLPTSSCPRSF